jgi:enoyl-CoA hydratase
VRESLEIIVHVEAGVGRILLNRPDRANAYTDDMVQRMTQALERFAGDDQIRAVIIGSAIPGRFCAGADLDEIRSRTAEDGFKIPSMALFDQLEALPQPTIAAIDGPAIAGGFEMALACDIRVASPRARFALPETRLGILPAAGGTWRLPRVVGSPVAREVILFGGELDGERAWRVGLVNQLVPELEVMSRAVYLASQAAARDRQATQLAKRALAKARSQETGRDFVQEAQSKMYARNGEERS